MQFFSQAVTVLQSLVIAANGRRRGRGNWYYPYPAVVGAVLIYGQHF